MYIATASIRDQPIGIHIWYLALLPRVHNRGLLLLQIIVTVLLEYIDL